MSNIWLDPLGLKLLKRRDSDEEEEEEQVSIETEHTKHITYTANNHPGYNYRYSNPYCMPYYVCQYPQPVQCYSQVTWPSYQYCYNYNYPPQANNRCHCHTESSSSATTVTKKEKKEKEKETKKTDQKGKGKAKPTFWNPRTGH